MRLTGRCVTEIGTINSWVVAVKSAVHGPDPLEESIRSLRASVPITSMLLTTAGQEELPKVTSAMVLPVSSQKGRRISHGDFRKLGLAQRVGETPG
ncbi:MAG: hypothetical protein ABWX63_09435 [Paeniglutamicibacter terrestris]